MRTADSGGRGPSGGAACRALGAFFFLGLAAAAAAATTCVDYRQYAHWVGEIDLPGHSRRVRAEGDHVYVLHDFGFSILDASDPLNPVPVGRLQIEVTPADFAVAGGRAYVAGFTAGFLIVDVSVPSSPTVLGHLDFPAAWSVAVEGQRACVVDRTFMHLVDVSNAQAPVVISTLDLGARCDDIVLRGNLVFASNWTEYDITIIDWSETQHPKIVARIADSYSEALSLEDDLLRIGYFSRMRIFDVADPSRPVVLSETFLDGSILGFLTRGQRTYAATSRGLEVLDSSDPYQPLQLVTVPVPGSIGGVAVLGDCAYIANGMTGVAMVDVRRPEPPQPLGTLHLDGLYRGPFWDSGRLYLGLWEERVSIYDVTDEAKPRQIGSIPKWGYVAARGDHAYVGSGSALYIYDVSRPEASYLKAQLAMPKADHICLSGSRAYVASDGLRIVDISDPSAPVLLGHLPLQLGAHRVAVYGDWAYVDGLLYLHCVDVSNPAEPRIARSIYTSTVGLAVSGDRLYASDGRTVVRIYDLANPAEPRQIGTIKGVQGVESFAVRGSMLYLTDLCGAVQLVDASDPAAPERIGHFGPVDYPETICLGEDAVYTLEGADLTTWPQQCGGTTPVALSELQATDTPDGIRIAWRAEGDFERFEVRRSAVEAPRGSEPIWTAEVPGVGPCQVLDRDALPDRLYTYEVVAHGRSGEVARTEPVLVRHTAAGAGGTWLVARPNPARGSATLRYRLAQPGDAQLDIYDLSGRRLRRLAAGRLAAGEGVRRWDGRDESGRDVAAGVYWVRLRWAGGESARRVVVLR
jgi:hypothetical protein